MAKDIYALGEIPPLGEVPARMHAQLVRPSRFGAPGPSKAAFVASQVPVPEIAAREVLAYVTAAGVDYINWVGCESERPSRPRGDGAHRVPVAADAAKARQPDRRHSKARARSDKRCSFF